MSSDRFACIEYNITNIIFYDYIIPICLCYRAGQYFSLLTGPGQYNVFFRISSDRFASIEYNITNSSWHLGPNGSLWTGLSPTK